ncbi:MAG: PAS domain-containing protein, partial [Sideroxydans sp.]
MSDSPEELQQQLLEAQEALAEAQARCKRHDTEHLAVTKELEDNRSALLFMLEDLESSRKQIEHSFREWMSALDVVDDPIFLHDREFRILRCNKAYQQLAGIPFKQIIGQPYYEIFPKAATPLPCCLRAMGKAAEEEEEEVTVGEAVYRSRAFFIRDE